MSKRILFIAPSSFPINGPEAITNAKLIKLLTFAGYVVDVISRDSPNRYFDASLDSRFTERVHSRKCLIVDNFVSFNSVLEHLKVFFKTGYVYKGAHWAYAAIKYAETLIARQQYDYILSRNPPSEIVGLYLAKKYKIKWIANWNDPYPEKRMPIPYGGGQNAALSYLEEQLLNEVSKYAYLHTFPTVRERDYMMKYINISLDRTEIIPHVCLRDSFHVEKGRIPNGKLLLVHSGNVSSPRNPVPFLEGLKAFVDKRNDASLEVRFIGKQSKDFCDIIEVLKLKDYVKIVPAMPYLGNLSFISHHHLALIIEAPSVNSVFLPTKVGDYMQCNKKIFAVSPVVGVLNDLYQDGKIDYYSDCVSSESVFLEIQKIYSDYELGFFDTTNKDLIISEYSPETILETYNRILT